MSLNTFSPRPTLPFPSQRNLKVHVIIAVSPVADPACPWRRLLPDDRDALHLDPLVFERLLHRVGDLFLGERGGPHLVRPRRSCRIGLDLLNLFSNFLLHRLGVVLITRGVHVQSAEPGRHLHHRHLLVHSPGSDLSVPHAAKLGSPTSVFPVLLLRILGILALESKLPLELATMLLGVTLATTVLTVVVKKSWASHLGIWSLACTKPVVVGSLDASAGAERAELVEGHWGAANRGH